MKEKTKAYIAGIMDAEGCFSISKRNTPSGGTHYEAHIIFTGSSKLLGQYAVKHFGGNCSHHPNGKYFHWQLWGKQAMLAFLTETIPYLFEKKEQAQILRDYINLNGRPNPPLREDMYRKIKELKGQECVTTETLDAFGSDKTDHAYLAGIFDGEGSLSLYQAIRNGAVSHYLKSVAVTNTCLPLLKRFVAAYGGAIRTKRQPGKQCYEWNLRSSKEIETFITSLLPYTIVKTPRMILMLDFVRLRGECPETRRLIYESFRSMVTTMNAKVKIQSELTGDRESAPTETLVA